MDTVEANRVYASLLLSFFKQHLRSFLEDTACVTVASTPQLFQSFTRSNLRRTCTINIEEVKEKEKGISLFLVFHFYVFSFCVPYHQS